MENIIDRNFKIFLVDDDPFYLKIAEKTLEKIGLQNIITFESGVSCVNHLHQNPDVIFLDYNMDIFSGDKVLNKVKRYNPNIFVVMLSAQEDIAIAVNALKYGAVDYIQKGKNEEAKMHDVLERIIKLEARTKQKKKKKKLIPKIF